MQDLRDHATRFDYQEQIRVFLSALSPPLLVVGPI